MDSINELRIAGWAEGTSTSALQQMLALTLRSDVISLALGFPDPDLLPSIDLAHSAREVLARDPNALQYQEPSSSRMREVVCDLMLQRGVKCEPENVFITAGAQQALSLIARLLLDDRGTIFEEEFSYPGFQKTIEPFRPCIVRIHSTAVGGIDTEMLDRLLDRHPYASFLYFMADGHNPLAISVGQERRREIAEIAQRRRIPFIEDDPYGLLRYEPDPSPAVRGFGGEYVWYVGSFSKVLAPALRLGWIVVPRHVVPKLSMIKEAFDINTVTFSQRIACHFFETHSFGDHLSCLRTNYRRKRDMMHEALGRWFPSGCRWKVPAAGVFFWVELPEGVDAGEVLIWALERERVAFLPAAAFSRGARHNAMRLCFSRCSISDIEEGVARIGASLKGFL